MIPALKLFLSAVFVLTFFASQLAVSFAQSSAQSSVQSLTKSRLLRISEDVVSSESALDDEAKELLAAGKPGFLIESARSEVLSLLSESNACTDWFLSAEPAAAEKFRSLRFVLDRAGAAEIVKLEGDGAVSGYYHPYVASTRQNVGPGSTITLNRNGAFFRSSALVRDAEHPADRISAASYKLLTVGRYTGGSPEAQLLTVLHEFGHIVDLLPVDADVPSAPFISIQNTETVLDHCRSQIEPHAKHLRRSRNSYKRIPTVLVYAANVSSPKFQALAQKRSFRGELSPRNDGW